MGMSARFKLKCSKSLVSSCNSKRHKLNVYVLFLSMAPVINAELILRDSTNLLHFQNSCFGANLFSERCSSLAGIIGLSAEIYRGVLCNADGQFTLSTIMLTLLALRIHKIMKF